MTAYVVEFLDLSQTTSVLDEIGADLTARQRYQLTRQIKRLETHGRKLNGAYFGTVKGSKHRLSEFRLTLDRVDYRILFAEENGVFLMLAGYKEKRNSIPAGKLSSAEQRLLTWRNHK